MAVRPRHRYRVTSGRDERVNGGLATLIHDAPNPEWTSFDWREYLFWQTFTSGRGLSWIERSGSNIVAIWPLESARTTLEQRGGQRWYRCADDWEGTHYPDADVMDEHGRPAGRDRGGR